MQNRLYAGVLQVLIFVFLAGCATTPSYVKQYEKDKIRLKAYFPAGPVFHLDRMFLDGDIDDYDIKIAVFRKDLSSKRKYLKTKRKGKNQYETDAVYDVAVTFEVVITGKNGEILLNADFRSHAPKAQGWAFGLNRASSENRVERNCIQTGIGEVRQKVAPEVLARVHADRKIRQIAASGADKINRELVNYAFSHAEIIICNRLKRGISDASTSAHMRTFAEDMKDQFETAFKKVQIVSGYSHVNHNQIIIHPRMLAIKGSTASDAYYGRGGTIILNTEIEVITFASSRVFAYQGVGHLDETAVTAIPQQFLGVATLGVYSQMQAAAYKSVAKARAQKTVTMELLNRILYDAEYRNYLENMQKYASRAVKSRMVMSKLPLSVMISLPTNIDDIHAEGHFVRSVSINSEKQAGTASVPLGRLFKETLIKEMEKRFEEVNFLGSGKGNAAFNPYNVSCRVGVEIEDIYFSTKPSPQITLKAKMKISAPTGAVYKELDIVSSGRVASAQDKGITESIAGGLSLTRVFIEGSIYQKKLEAGCRESLHRAVRECMAPFENDKFVSDFSEFAAYASAKENGTIDEIRHFLNFYSQSRYVDELNRLLDDNMFDYASKTENIEAYLDYLLTFPDGIHRQQARMGLENVLYSEIQMGNSMWCPVYGQFFTTGYHFQAVSNFCGGF